MSPTSVQNVFVWTCICVCMCSLRRTFLDFSLQCLTIHTSIKWTLSIWPLCCLIVWEEGMSAQLEVGQGRLVELWLVSPSGVRGREWVSRRSLRMSHGPPWSMSRGPLYHQCSDGESLRTNLPRRSWPFSSLSVKSISEWRRACCCPSIFDQSSDLNLYRSISLGRYRNRSLYILNRFCVCVLVHMCAPVGHVKGESQSRGLEKESWERNTKMCSLIPQPSFWKWESGKQYIFLREDKAISWAKGFFWGDVELLCDLREILDFSGLSSAQCSQRAMLIFIDYVWLSQVKDSPLTSE